MEAVKKVIKNVNITINGIRNLILRATNESLKPRWIVYMVTDRCNSRCIHCNIWQKEPTKNPLVPNEIEQVFKDDLFKDVKYVLCTGGEPTVRNDFKEIILSIHKALPEATIQLSTNGLLPERVIEVVKTAITNDICLDVGVSLDGIGEKHDKIRCVKGNFEKVDWLLHEIAPLREKYGDRLFISLQITLSDITLDSLKEVRAYAQQLNVYLLEGWYNESSFYNNIGEEHVGSSNKFIETIKSQPDSPLKDLWLRKLTGKSIKFPCFAMYTFCVLKCNGDIVPCLNLWDMKTGNVRDKSPTDIWHSYETKRVRKIIKSCEGCLNSWGAPWSLSSSYYPILLFYLKHPRLVIEKLRKV